MPQTDKQRVLFSDAVEKSLKGINNKTQATKAHAAAADAIDSESELEYGDDSD